MIERHGQGPFSLLSYIYYWEVEIYDKFAEWYNGHSFPSGKAQPNAPNLRELIRYGYSAKSEDEVKELDVLLRWYGIGCDSESLAEIGKSYNVTGSRIQQIRIRARRILLLREKRSGRIKARLQELGFEF